MGYPDAATAVAVGDAVKDKKEKDSYIEWLKSQKEAEEGKKEKDK